MARTLYSQAVLRYPYHSSTSACQRLKAFPLRRSMSCLMVHPAISQILRSRRARSSMRRYPNMLSAQMRRLDETEYIRSQKEKISSSCLTINAITTKILTQKKVGAHQNLSLSSCHIYTLSWTRGRLLMHGIWLVPVISGSIEAKQGIIKHS